MCVCVCVCICVCVCVYIYIYIYIYSNWYIYIQTEKMCWCFPFHPNCFRIIPVRINLWQKLLPVVWNVFNQKSRTALDGVKVGQQLILCLPIHPNLNIQLPNESCGMHLSCDTNCLALLAFKPHERINTYKPVPRPPHLTVPFYLMQLINLQDRLARADTRLTVRIFLECHLTVLSVAGDTHSQWQRNWAWSVWWNNTDRGKPKYPEKHMSQRHSVHHWPAIEPGPLQWEAGCYITYVYRIQMNCRSPEIHPATEHSGG